MQRLQRPLETEPAAIKLVVFDVDGVLTDNKMYFLRDNQEAKAFNAADGFAIKATTGRQLHYAVISARESDVTTRRCRELGIGDIVMQWNKLTALQELAERHRLPYEEIAYVGNDIPDIVALEKVGLAVCVADCEPELLACSHYQTSRTGGHGAAREVIKFLLASRGLDLVSIYRDGIGSSETG